MAAAIGAVSLAVDGDVPDLLDRHRRRQRRRPVARARRLGHLPPRPGPADLLRHAGAEGRAHAGPDSGPDAARLVGAADHRLAHGILVEAPEIADDPHRGALVEHPLDLVGQRDVLDVEFRDGEAVLRHRGRDRLGDQLAELAGVGRHVEHRDARGGDGAAEFLHDDVADLEADLVGGELAIGADDLGDEAGRVGRAHGIGAEGAQPDRAEFRVAGDDRVARAPFLVGEAGGVDEVDLGLERRLEAVVPVLEPGQHRHVVGLEHPQARAEHVGDLPLMDEDRRLPLAHGQLGAVLDRVPAGLEPPDHGVAAVVRPGDDLDELAGEKVEQGHETLPSRQWVEIPAAGGWFRRGHDRPSSSAVAIVAASGRTSASVIPGRSRGS